MMVTFLLLTVADAIFLYTFIRGRDHWATKATVMLLALALNFTIIGGNGSGTGFAKRTALPPSSQFVACIVNEPDPEASDPGSIFLWVIPAKPSRPLIGYRSQPGEPRAYREPYTESLQQLCQQAAQAKKAGGPVMINRTPKKNKHHGHSAHTEPGTYHLYVLPAVQPPRKRGS